jgi:hypothetical protein
MTDSDQSGGAQEDQTTQSIFLSLFEVKAFKAAANFFGVVGAGGGGFATLAFGIGYLAIKKHDTMVGLPTTVVDITTYVRTGAMFFSNTLVLICSTPTTYVLIGLILSIAFTVAFRRYKDERANISSPPPSVEGHAGKQYLGVFTLQLLLFVFALLLINVQSATLHPDNTNLINQMLRDRQTELDGDDGADQQSEANLLPMSILYSADNRLRVRVNNALRHIDGRSKLQQFFGDQIVLILLLLSLFAALRVWRKRWQEIASESWDRIFGPWWSSMTDTAVYVMLYVLTLAILLNIPATYGVLVLPTEGAQVTVVTTDNHEGSGILLTDMSSQGDTVWILGKEKAGNKVRPKLLAFDRSKVSEVVLIGQTTPNYLAID